MIARSDPDSINPADALNRAADLSVVAGHFAPATTRCGCHPPVARREAPHNQRIHLTKSVHDPYRAHAQICR